MTVIDNLRTRLDGLNTEIRSIGVQVESRGEGATLMPSEDRRYRTLRTERTQVEARIAQLETEDQRAAAEGRAALITGNGFTRFDGLRVGADSVYARGSGRSYFGDLVRSAMPGSRDAWEATERLSQHAQVVDRAAGDLPHEFRINPNRTDGQGGYAVPPLWLIGDFIALLRAGRPLADRCNRQDLPPGTDSLNVPKMLTGTTTAIQTGDGGAVASQDLTDTFISAPVRTIAGQQDVSMQLLEQSPAAFDEIVFSDLIADYNRNVDIQVLAGTGAAGQVAGILPMVGTNAVTYTSGAPKGYELVVPVAQGLSQVASNRFLPADTVAMHPRRWFWLTATLDSQNRPLVTPEGGSGVNVIAVDDAQAAEGVAGSISGVPVVVDSNLPTTLGAGNNQDEMVVGRFSDAWLFEGELRTRALMEVLSGTLQCRLQVYNYLAFAANRYPAAFSLINGTGLVAPAGY